MDTNEFRDLHDIKCCLPHQGASYRLVPDAMKAVIQFLCQRAAEQDFAGLFPHLTALRVAAGRQMRRLPGYTPFLTGESL